MRTLTQCEVESVSGGMSWNDIWNAIKKWCDKAFSSGGQSANGVLNNNVNGCINNGGTANYTVNGTSYTINTDAGGSTAGDDGLLGVRISGGTNYTVTNFTLDCTGAHRGGNGREPSPQ